MDTSIYDLKKDVHIDATYWTDGVQRGGTKLEMNTNRRQFVEKFTCHNMKNLVFIDA